MPAIGTGSQIALQPVNVLRKMRLKRGQVRRLVLDATVAVLVKEEPVVPVTTREYVCCMVVKDRDIGYGGSCFPKDIRALAQMERKVGLEPRMLDALDAINTAQKQTLIAKLEKHFDGPPRGKTIAVWGLAFKPRTDDIREAPALVLVDYLLRSGARVQAHDPEAMENVKREYSQRQVEFGPVDQRLRFADHPLDCLEGADALVINTEWSVFRNPDFDQMKKLLRAPLIFDGRNLYSPETMREYGFTYYSIGRAPVTA